MGDFAEFEENEVLKEINNLMLTENIRPEPEYQFFSKYLAKSTKENFFEDEDEIFYLINAHGVQLKNDIKYWLGKSKNESCCDENKKETPVLDPKHFEISNFDDVVNILKELPSEWTIVQITKKFSLNDVTRKEEIPEIHIIRLACGELTNKVHPYAVTTEDRVNFQENMFKSLKNLAQMRREFHMLGRTCNKLYEAFYKTNAELESFVKELESYVLGSWICLLQGRLKDTNLEKDTLTQLKKIIKTFCKEENIKLNANQFDIIYQLTLGAHILKNKNLFKTLMLVLCHGNESFNNVGKVMLLVENIKMLNISNCCALKRAARQPLILILDNEFEMVPWEMITSLTGQPVCRISSLHLLYALYKYHKPNIKNGFRMLEIDSMYSLVNPSEDLKDSEKKMREFFTKRLPWAEVDYGKAPDPKDLLMKIEEYTVYLYCGHGSGSQYIKAIDLRKTFMKGLILLFGCSSNIPKNCGGRTPHQNLTYTYIINGCPCVIGCIQDLGSCDADHACVEIMSSIMPSVAKGDEKTVQPPKEPNVLLALASGRQACVKYWSRSAFVARGIPCQTVVGNENIIKSV